MPFLAEELYQNLVVSVNENAPISVHLADWPVYQLARIDEKLNREMALVIKLASLGHAARNKANRKVRQPLAEVAFSIGNIEERGVVEQYADLLSDELNVKKVRVLDTAGEAVSYSLNPQPKQLGQKYGSRFPAIRQGILAAQSEEAAHKLLAGGTLPVTAGGETLEILPEEVEVRAQARTGFVVATEGAYLAALVTELTSELVEEGLAREFVRRVQDLRKQADLDIAERIHLYYEATPGLQKAIDSFRDYIMGETLTVEMTPGTVPPYLPQASDSFDGESVKLGVTRKS
jgi:isoleucyl-tRNA synthetase